MGYYLNRVCFSVEIPAELYKAWKNKLKTDKLTQRRFFKDAITQYLREKAD